MTDAATKEAGKATKKRAKKKRVTKKKLVRRTPVTAAEPKKRTPRKKTRKGSASPEQSEAIDVVAKLEELDILRFGKLDAELRNHGQGIQIIDLQLSDLAAKYRDQVASLSARKKSLEASIAACTPEYQLFVAVLARKHGIEDPSKMSIDVETGIVRDLTKDT